MWNPERIEANLKEALSKNKHLPIYPWSFDGELEARGPGWGWKIQIHFEDSTQTQTGGVLHVTLDSGNKLTGNLCDQLEAWFNEASKKYPGNYEPRIRIFADS
ncbi:MAG TPA: hypothetical protein VN132_12825 [Bdellovibrio sp.]|nr:hypothetical protein [Bdellovibrio sp.]